MLCQICIIPLHPSDAMAELSMNMPESLPNRFSPILPRRQENLTVRNYPLRAPITSAPARNVAA